MHEGVVTAKSVFLAKTGRFEASLSPAAPRAQRGQYACDRRARQKSSRPVPDRDKSGRRSAICPCQDRARQRIRPMHHRSSYGCSTEWCSPTPPLSTTGSWRAAQRSSSAKGCPRPCGRTRTMGSQTRRNACRRFSPVSALSRPGDRIPMVGMGTHAPQIMQTVWSFTWFNAKSAAEACLRTCIASNRP